MTGDIPSRPRVLITGTLGRIGTQIVPGLARDHDLVLVDVRPDELAGLPVHARDLVQPGTLDDLMKGVDIVVHLAISRFQGVRANAIDEQADDIMRVNVMGTQHVAESARRAGVKRIVFMSSLTVYLGAPAPERIGPDTPIRPHGLYACTKLFGEQLLESYSRDHGIAVVCLRLGQPYPTQSGWMHPPSNPRCRGLMVGYEDIERAVRCAMTHEGDPFTVVDIVSESDARWIDLSGAERIGYRPGQVCTESGFAGWPEAPPPPPDAAHDPEAVRGGK